MKFKVITRTVYSEEYEIELDDECTVEDAANEFCEKPEGFKRSKMHMRDREVYEVVKVESC